MSIQREYEAESRAATVLEMDRLLRYLHNLSDDKRKKLLFKLSKSARHRIWLFMKTGQHVTPGEVNLLTYIYVMVNAYTYLIFMAILMWF